MTIVTRSPATAANYNNPVAPGRDLWAPSGVNSASILVYQPAGLSVDLVFSGFDFASQIPAGATINGIAFSYLGSSDVPTASDARVVLRVGNGPDSTNKAKAGSWPHSGTSRSYGSTVGDTWDLAAANPGMTLSEIVRSADFAVAVQINNGVGDPEDLARTYLNGAAISVDWALPVTIKSVTAAAASTMTGEARIGILTNLTMAGGAQLDGVARVGRRVDMAALGSASLTPIAVASIAAPAVTPPWRSVAITERGERTATLTQSGSTKGEI